MKTRVKKTASIFIILAVIGIAYFFIYKALGFGIPCVFQEITGLKCPGCGVTKMCSYLLALDFYSAFWANPCLFILLPVILYFLAKEIYCYIRYGSTKFKKAENVVLVIVIIILLAFAVFRNIVGI